VSSTHRWGFVGFCSCLGIGYAGSYEASGHAKCPGFSALGEKV